MWWEPNCSALILRAVRHLWEAARLGVGESDLNRMKFAGMSLGEAIEAFRPMASG
jgi:hypothetical protein